jgi:hypothetical protein
MNVLSKREYHLRIVDHILDKMHQNVTQIRKPNTAEYSAEVRPNSEGGRAEPNIRPNASAEYSVLPNFGTSLIPSMACRDQYSPNISVGIMKRECAPKEGS